MNQKILIIDDEPDVVEFQKSFLTRRKYIVDIARNTSEALEMIKSFSPDLVFCDVRLDTDRAGLSILEQARKIKPELIVYLVTGLLERDIEDQGLALGAKGILTKPVTNEVLEKKIHEALGINQLAANNG